MKLFDEQIDTEENGSIWVCALLLEILFQDRDIIHEPTTMRAIPTLAILLKSEETANKYFAAQALASLICNGSRGTLLAVANSGVVGGIIPLLGCVEERISKITKLSKEFSLVHKPENVALQW